MMCVCLCSILNMCYSFLKHDDSLFVLLILVSLFLYCLNVWWMIFENKIGISTDILYDFAYC